MALRLLGILTAKLLENVKVEKWEKLTEMMMVPKL
jgi:hypothetical protein